MSNSSPIQVANDCEEQVSPLLDIESSSKKRFSGTIGNIDYNNDEQEEMFLKSIVAAVREEVGEEGEEEKMKEERKVSFARAVTGLDNLVLFCQQQDLSVDIQLYSQLKQLRKRIVGKSIAAKKQTCLEDFINFEIQ